MKRRPGQGHFSFADDHQINCWRAFHPVQQLEDSLSRFQAANIEQKGTLRKGRECRIFAPR